MSSNWLETKLGDVVELKRGFDLPESQRESGSVPIVSSSGISGYHSTFKAKAPGVVTGRYGTIGEVFYITNDYWPLNTALFVKDFKGNDPRFIYYLLQTIDFESCSDKGAVPGVNRNDLHQLMVEIPGLPEQQAISYILGCLDDKIDLNRRMNRTLEEMAAAIYKSWFVDFDPVVAKSEGLRPFGMSDEIASLFPSSFDNSQTAPIPKGWEIKKVADICNTQYGYTTSASDEQVGPKFLRITDMNKEPWIEWRNVPYCEIHPSIYPKYKLNIGDVLVSRMADPGKAAIIEEEVESVFASYLVRLKTRSLPLSFFLFYFLRSDQYLDYANGVKIGAVQSGMNAKIIVDCNIVLPEPELIDHFYSIIKPLRQKITSNLREINTLSQIRDSILPKLLSGEIHLKQAETITEE